MVQHPAPSFLPSSITLGNRKITQMENFKNCDAQTWESVGLRLKRFESELRAIRPLPQPIYVMSSLRCVTLRFDWILATPLMVFVMTNKVE